MSILLPAIARRSNARVHFICTSCPGTRWKNENEEEEAVEEGEEEKGIHMVNCDEHNSKCVSVHVKRTRCAATSMGNRKKHKIGISFASNTLFFVVFNILDAFVRQTKFFNFSLSPSMLSAPCVCSVWTGEWTCSVFTLPRMISHSIRQCFASIFWILCSTYEQTCTNFPFCRCRHRHPRRRRCDITRATLHSFFMSASIIHPAKNFIYFVNLINLLLLFD